MPAALLRLLPSVDFTPGRCCCPVPSIVRRKGGEKKFQARKQKKVVDGTFLVMINNNEYEYTHPPSQGGAGGRHEDDEEYESLGDDVDGAIGSSIMRTTGSWAAPSIVENEAAAFGSLIAP